MNRFRSILAAAVAIGVLLPVSCRKEAPVDESDVLAKVGGRPIRVAEFERELEWRRARGRPLAGRQELLDEIVEYEALLEYARSNGIEEDPELRRAYSNLLIGKLKERELTPKLEAVTATDEEIQAAYEERRDDLTTPELRRLSIILVAKPAHTSDGKAAELRARIDEARELATSDEGFAVAAAKFSDDQASRYRAGDVGWTEAGKPHARLPMEVLNAGHALRSDGELSGVIDAGDGFYLVARTALKPAELPPLERVADRLRTEILRNKREQATRAFEQAVRAAIPVELFPERLSDARWQAAPREPADSPPENP